MRWNKSSSAANTISVKRIRFLRRLIAGVFLLVTVVSVVPLGLNQISLAAENTTAKQSATQTASKKWPDRKSVV